jgi:hypothetical protein
MSIEFYVYSEKTAAPGFDTLRNALLEQGWHVAFIHPEEEMRERTAGIVSNDVIYGTRDLQVLQQVRTLLAKRDEKTLEDLFESEKVGGCGITASMGFDAKEEYGEDLPNNFPKNVLPLVERTRSRYTVRTSAGRGELAFELQVAAWETLGQLVEGLLEDPQSGRYLRMGPRGREVLHEAEAEEGSPVDALMKFFEPAKAAGFAVTAKKNEDVSLKTDTLTKGDLERLLKLARDHFPAKDFSGPAMVQMILEEYARKKGEAFAREQEGWLAEMQEKYGAF